METSSSLRVEVKGFRSGSLDDSAIYQSYVSLSPFSGVPPNFLLCRRLKLNHSHLIKSVPCLSVKEDGCIFACTAGAELLFGSSAALLQNRNVQTLIPDWNTMFAEPLRAIKDSSGKYSSVSIDSFALRSANFLQDCTRIVGVCIGPEKRLERAAVSVSWAHTSSGWIAMVALRDSHKFQEDQNEMYLAADPLREDSTFVRVQSPVGMGSELSYQGEREMSGGVGCDAVVSPGSADRPPRSGPWHSDDSKSSASDSFQGSRSPLVINFKPSFNEDSFVTNLEGKHVIFGKEVYQVRRLLGTGSFASVYEARCVKPTGSEHSIALKLLLDDHCSADISDMIANEVKVLRSLQHPNIVKLLSVYWERGKREHASGAKNSSSNTKSDKSAGTDKLSTSQSVLVRGISGENDSDLPTICPLYSTCQVLEYVKGRSLKSFVEDQSEGVLQETALKQVFFQLQNALQYLHSQLYVHRDLQLENILIEETNPNTLSVKLIDFGLAYKRQHAKENMTSAVGSSLYMAPEMFSASPSYRANVDVWSFGICLFYCALGTFPFLHPMEAISGLHGIEGMDLFLAMYEESLQEILQACLDTDADARPDIEHLPELDWFKPAL